jgi:retinol-binding protein 3
MFIRLCFASFALLFGGLALAEAPAAPALPDTPAATSRESTLDQAQRVRLIEGTEKLLNELYVFPDVAKSMSAALRRQQKRGDYRAITDSVTFATRLTDDLRAVSHDKHVSVHFSPEILPPDPPDELRRPEIDPARARRLTAGNCGFQKAEHLPPNIGYLRLDQFAPTEVCAPTAIAAMNFLADSDSIIIDLRDNHGGRAEMVALLASYLFDAPRHLDDICDRQRNTTEQTWTFPYVPGKRFTGKPVFVLTSGRTFSAAEEFSYDLKYLGRATLIGETTGGGAHTVGPHRLDDHFFVEVPFGRFVNPITKTDWEGTGVEPDVKVPAADALTEALKRARGN